MKLKTIYIGLILASLSTVVYTAYKYIEESRIKAEIEPDEVVVYANCSLCGGGSVDLSANFSGGTAINYDWGHIAGTDNPSDITEAPLVTTVYTVTITDVSGCTTSASSTVTVSPALSVSVDSDSGICDGESVAFSWSGGDNTYYNTYILFNGSYISGGLNFTSNTSQTIPERGSGTYEIEVEDASGCISTASKAITVSPNLVVSNPASSIICDGDDIDWTWQAAVPPYDVTVRKPDLSEVNTSVGSNSYSFPEAGVGQYRITVIDANGCSDIEYFSPTITGPITGNITGDDTACQNVAVTLTANPSGSAPYTYSWSLFGGSSQTAVYASNTTTTYYVTVTGSGGYCEEVFSHTITINDNITTAGSIAGASNGCEPFQAATFTSTAPASGGSGGAIEYQWQRSTNGGATYDDVVGATLETYTPPVINAANGIWTYRRKARREGCNLWKNTSGIAIYATENQGIDWASNTLSISEACNANNDYRLNFSGDLGIPECGTCCLDADFSYKLWLRRSGDGSNLFTYFQRDYSDCSYVTNSTVNATYYQVTVAGFYELVREMTVTGGSCSIPSPALTVVATANVTQSELDGCTCNPLTDGGSIATASNSPSCSGTFNPNEISNTGLATGGIGGMIEYRWLQSSDGVSGWTVVTGRDWNSFGHTFLDLNTLSTTRFYKRQARRDCDGIVVESNIVSIVVANMYADAQGDVTGCDGDAYNFDLTWNGGVAPFEQSYSINGSGFSSWSTSNINQGGRSYPISGIHGQGTPSVEIWKVRDANGCEVQFSYTISETAPPVANSLSSDVCVGDDVTFSWTGMTPFAIDFNRNGLTNSLTNQYVYSIDYPENGTGTYAYTVTDAYGCSDTYSTTITQRALPVIAALPDDVCENAQLTYNWTSSTVNDSYSYNANGATNSGSTSVDNLSVDINGTGNYALTITDSYGCVDTYTKSVNENQVVVTPTETITKLGDCFAYVQGGVQSPTCDAGCCTNGDFTATYYWHHVATNAQLSYGTYDITNCVWSWNEGLEGDLNISTSNNSLNGEWQLRVDVVQTTSDCAIDPSTRILGSVTLSGCN